MVVWVSHVRVGHRQNQTQKSLSRNVKAFFLLSIIQIKYTYPRMYRKIIFISYKPILIRPNQSAYSNGI